MIFTKTIKVYGNNDTTIKTNNASIFYMPPSDNNTEYYAQFSVFENINFKGVGTTYGVNAAGYGIKIGNESDVSYLANTPFIRIKNCTFFGFKKGVYIEGYGHTIQDSKFLFCETGLEIIHPEQVLCSNCWIEYCDLGLALNKTKQLYGHNFKFFGGSIQRNKHGALLFNTYEVFIDTYHELNWFYDISLGDPDNANNYVKGCKNVRINVSTSALISENAIGHILVHATIGADISCYQWTDTYNKFICEVSGYSKYITIHGNTEAIKTSSPFNITGDAKKTTFIVLNNNEHYDSNGKLLFTDNITSIDNGYKMMHSYFDSGEYIGLDKSNHSQFAIRDITGNENLFYVRNNPTAAYRDINCNIPININSTMKIKLNNITYKLTTDDGVNIKLVRI